jgi:hypothetical protein
LTRASLGLEKRKVLFAKLVRLHSNCTTAPERPLGGNRLA